MRKTLSALWPYLRRYRRGLVTGIVALLVRNLAGAAIPLMIGYAVDRLAARFEFRLAF